MVALLRRKSCGSWRCTMQQRLLTSHRNVVLSKRQKHLGSVTTSHSGRLLFLEYTCYFCYQRDAAVCAFFPPLPDSGTAAFNGHWLARLHGIQYEQGNSYHPHTFEIPDFHRTRLYLACECSSISGPGRTGIVFLIISNRFFCAEDLASFH